MNIQRIYLKSFRCFDQTEWTFHSTVQILSFGPRGGKTSFCRAVQTAFLPAEPQRLAVLIRRGMDSSVVEIEFKLNNTSWTIRKHWSSQALLEWTAKSIEKKYDLSRQEDLDNWIHHFIEENGWPVRQHCPDVMYRELLFEYYSHWIRIITGYPELDVNLIADNRFWLCLGGQIEHLFTQIKISRLKQIAKQYDENTRQQRYQAIFSKKQSEELKKALAELTERITRHENKISELQKELEQKQTEQKRWERLRLYTAEKESEAERLSFEIDTYESFLHENDAELSESEFAELEKQKNRYEALQKKIVDLEGQLIEQEHLEKNLVNLLKETEALETWLQSSDSTHPGINLQKQLLDYQDEIKKIRQSLKKTPRLKKELEEAQIELNTYRRGHDYYEVLTKIRQWTQQNNRKSIQNALEQARKKRSSILNELEELSRNSPAEQEETCRLSVRQTENLLIHARLQFHQLKEQYQVLAERQQKAFAQIKTETDTPLFSTHAYLTMMDTIYTSLMNQYILSEKKMFFSALIETIKKINTINELKIPDELTARLEPSHFEQTHWESLLNDDFGLSHSEKNALLLHFRFLLMQRYSKSSTLILDSLFNYDKQFHKVNKNQSENIVSFYYHQFSPTNQPLQLIVLN